MAGTGTYAGGHNLDYITVKYNTHGIEQWVAHYNGTADSYEELMGLALDSSGNVYVTGLSYGGYDTLNEDYATVKYNPSGIQQWVARYNGPSRSSDYARAIAVDGHGNSYVTGRSWNSSTSRDIATIKYDAFGQQKWAVRYHEPEPSSAEGTSIAVDAGGHVYITGSSSSEGGGLDYTTIKYDTSGAKLWVKRYNGPANQDDAASAMKLDRSGNIYVTGYSQGSDTTSDFATVKYDPDGTELWVARYNGPGNGDDEAVALAIGSSGFVHVAGRCEGSGSLFDMVAVTYDSERNTRHVARFDEPELPDNYVTAIAAGADESIYLAGYSGSEEKRRAYYTYIGIGNKSSKYTLVKYSPEPLSVRGFDSHESASFKFEQNYPNPFNPSTVIRYALAHASHVILRVFNLLGEEVATLVQQDQAAGYHEVRFDGSSLASGVYLCRLEAGTFIQSRKLLLLR